MLEGQVAVLSARILSGAEAADLLDAMRQSALYREDQQSYMLYPARRRPSFLEMNNLPADAATLPVVQKYLGTILKQDCDGGIHFDAAFRNANNLPDELKDLYEQVFHHHAFTGRSGTFYKYEGLGSIYWHMVSKLLLAVGENIRSVSQDWLTPNPFLNTVPSRKVSACTSLPSSTARSRSTRTATRRLWQVCSSRE